MKKMMMTILMLFVMSVSLLATNYVVSGAGSAEVNGTYVENGTQNGKPYYQFVNGGTIYAIGYDGLDWIIGEEMMPGMILDYYTNSAPDVTPLLQVGQERWE